MNDSVDENELKRIADISPNPIVDAGLPCIFENGKYRIDYCPLNELSVDRRKLIFSQLETNVRAFYEIDWGWDPNERKRELFSASSKFIFVVNPDDDEVLAWVMFKFDWDDVDEPEHPVLYLYEIHVTESQRCASLGTQVACFLFLTVLS